MLSLMVPQRAGTKVGPERAVPDAPRGAERGRFSARTISVRNEEGAIAKTVERSFEADYPSHLREGVVVDAGSSDGTAKVPAALQIRFAAFGDDRSLTNYILRKNRVVYNDRAVASTWGTR